MVLPMSNPLEILQRYWHHSSFRPLQQEIIQSVLAGKDVLTLLPTGGGKSICFQIPALMRPGVCIVISPLIALMTDQVTQLRKRSIAAEVVFAGMHHREIDLILDNCIYGQVKLLYISPERLQTELMQTRVSKMPINLLAVDEAHCISQWGYDFRPSYLKIASFRRLIPHVNCIALTATATPKVQKDIQEKLSLRNAIRFQQSFVRKNLVYVVRKTEDKDGQLLNILHRVPGTAIVYVNTRQRTEVIAQFLQKKQIATTAYHAGLARSERTMRQASWHKGTTRIMVATNAFGMGIDKRNVRTVIHLDLPTTPEAYYQEAGRAGRDGKKAYAIILYDDQDIIRLRESIQIAHPSLEQIKKVYQHLANYYQVAVGSFHMTTYDFCLEDFTHTYRLQRPVTYQVLKTLDREEIIQFNPSFSQSSRLRIAINAKRLYAFQVAHAHYDLLIKALLRLYGGELFSTLIQISLHTIARLLNSNVQQIHTRLQDLDRLAIVHYYPLKHKPQLAFITPRYPATSLPVDKKRLQQRAKIAQRKMEEMIRYVMHTYTCRTQLLLAYFGETTQQKCEQCDVCLAKQDTQYAEADYQKYRHLILQHIRSGVSELNQIIHLVSRDLTSQQHIIATIRQMLDSGELAYDDGGRLVIK